jgi:hypothetical protein
MFVFVVLQHYRLRKVLAAMGVVALLVVVFSQPIVCACALSL